METSTGLLQTPYVLMRRSTLPSLSLRHVTSLGGWSRLRPAAPTSHVADSTQRGRGMGSNLTPVPAAEKKKGRENE